MEKEKREGFQIRLTPTEKQLLIEKQKLSGYSSISEYIRRMCFQEKDNTLESLIGNVAPTKPISSDGQILDKRISFRVTEEEYVTVLRYAGNMSISAYCRKAILSSQLGAYNFEIADGDLKDLAKQLTEFNFRLEGIIGALSHQSQLFKTNIDQIQRMLKETNESIKESYRTVLTDRKYIRKKGVENLKKQIEKVFIERRMEQWEEKSQS